MYEQKKLVTYFWARIPRTAVTAVISIPGAPVPNTTVIIHDEIVDSVKCGTEPLNEPAQRLTAPLCWGADGDLVYHRTETVTAGARRQATGEGVDGAGGEGGK